MTTYKPHRFYMCATDFHTEWHLDRNYRPEMYRTQAQLKRTRTCWRKCGIVEVQVIKSRDVVKGKR